MEYKMKNVLPKLEDTILGHMYAFTINPETQYFDDLERMPKVINYIKRLLSNPYIEYELYIELSPTGRIHGHGWIWLQDPFKFYLHEVHKLTQKATIVIKEIDNPQVWLDYCIKQSHITRIRIQRMLPKLSDNLIKTDVLDIFAKYQDQIRVLKFEDMGII